jgi:hypothetical protein
MKWLLIVICTAALIVSAQTKCNIYEFKLIASTLHDPTERHNKLMQWLNIQGSKCSKENLIVIWNNLAMWAGTADNEIIRAQIIYLFEKSK